MARGLILLFLAGALGGCVSQQLKPAVRANTLTGNDRLPHLEMELMSQPKQWELMRNLEYSGYEIIAGQIGDDGHVRITKLVESYPENSRDRLAYALAGKVVLKASIIGTRMPPAAEIYIVFYEKLGDSNLAFVYARQVDYTVAGPSRTAAYLNAVKY